MAKLFPLPYFRILQNLILGCIMVFAGIAPALASEPYSDEDLRYLIVRYHGLRLANKINEHQLDFVIHCFKNPGQSSITYTLTWAQGESIETKLDCEQLKNRGLIEKAQRDFPKMRHALILSQVSQQLFMIPGGEIASETLDADLGLQISLNPFHPYGLTAPAHWLKDIYDASLFQLSSLPAVSPMEKEYYRELQNHYSRTFCADFMKNLSQYIDKYGQAPSIFENAISGSHPLLKDPTLCENFLLKHAPIGDRTDLNVREKKALNLLRKEYLQYSAQRRRDLRLSTFQEYSNLIASTPILLFMDSPQLTDSQWIAALEKMKANGDVRSLVNLSEKELSLVEDLAENLSAITRLSPETKKHLGDELWPLLQSPNGALPALELLKRHFPEKTAQHAEAATHLQQAWEADYTLKRNVRMVIFSGAVGVCLIPASRVISVATALILKRGCMAATGLPINAYVFTYSLTRYERRMAMLLSTFEESNSIIDMSLLNREKRAFVFAALMTPIGNQTQALGETSKLFLQKVRLVP